MTTRRFAFATTLLALSMIATAIPSGALPVELPWLIKSDNVAWHGTVPLDYPGVGGKVVDHADGNRYFYANGGKGITIYDISDPLTPIPVGMLNFPYSQGENLAVSDDGTRAVLGADGFLPYMPNYVTTGVHVVDLTDPTAPELIATNNDAVAGRGVGLGISEHTVACPDAACDYAYGSSTGNIYDLTKADEGVITVAERKWNVALDGQDVGGRHALNRDERGLVIADSKPRMILATSPEWHPEATPLNPIPLSTGNAAAIDAGNVMHNNMRTGADEWVARDADETVATQAVEVVDERAESLVDERPVMRPGELVIGTSESNINPRCDGGNGGISTWSMVNFDQGEQMQQLEYFAPYNGAWVDNGAPAAQWAGCSAHWFDVTDDHYVAASWYEHGTRFFHVDEVTGTIEEVGYYQSVQGIAVASYWVTDEVVYSVDGQRGFEILVFDRDESKRPSAAERTASWLRTATNVSQLAVELQKFCRLSVSD